MGNRMGRSRPAASACSRPGECRVRDKHERNRAERRDQRAIHFMRHDRYRFVGDGAAFWRTLGPAFGARKRIINYWLRRNINGRRASRLVTTRVAGRPAPQSRSQLELDHSRAAVAILPGRANHPVNPLLQKYSDLQKDWIRPIFLPVPSQRGATRDRHVRGAGCGGRGCALRRQVLKRTVKSCRSGSPTLESSSQLRSAGDGGKQARSPRRART